MATRSRDDDLDDEDDFDDEDDESANSPVRPAVKPTLRERIRSGGQAGTGPAATERTTKRAIEQLDDRERWICFAASGLAVLTGLLIYIVETENCTLPTA